MIDIETINSDPMYAPIGYEQEFKARIRDEVYQEFQKLRIDKKIRGAMYSKVKAHKINEKYYGLIEAMLKTGFFYLFEDADIYDKYYKKYKASWDHLSSRSTKDDKYPHRKKVKKLINKYFNKIYNETCELWVDDFRDYAVDDLYLKLKENGDLEL